MAGVILNHVAKRYSGADEDAVKDFHLGIEDKEFLVLVGASGCGKSTILRMIAGLEEITSGDIYIGDRLVNNMAPKDRDIAMVFQSYALYPHMTVYENLSFSIKLRKLNKDEIDKRVHEAAKILDIAHLLDRKPKALSGGQRQRVALGRAIVRDPKVFLMDEPLSNLDAKLRVQMRAEISKLHKRLETTFIYVTHDQTEAMTMGNRIVVMNKGIIQQAATPEVIYNHPANRFVAGFIGSPPMNFMNGVLIEEEGTLFFKAKGVNVAIPQDKAKILCDKSYAKKEVILGIRPEDIHTNSSFLEGSQDSALNAFIDVVENLGHKMNLYIRGICKDTFIACVAAHAGFAEGTQAKLHFDMNNIHLFDEQTECNILDN